MQIIVSVGTAVPPVGPEIQLKAAPTDVYRCIRIKHVVHDLNFEKSLELFENVV